MKILLIGAGYHARRIYIPYFMNKKHPCDANLICGLDLNSQKGIINDYLSKNGYALKMFYIDDGNHEKIIHQNKELLNNIISSYGIDSVIISTEPLVHYKYAKWALENNLNILMDKPVTTEKDVSINKSRAKKLVSDYVKLKKLYLERGNGNKIVFSLMAQRRFHPAYQLMKEKIKEVFLETNCPVTSIQACHSDGQWRMPTEIIEQDYHPYNQGYGKCSHSGYHSIDTVLWLIGGAKPENKKFDNADVYSSFLRPVDFMHQLNSDDYRRLFSNFDANNKYKEKDFNNKSKNFGEIDAFCNVTLKDKDKIVCLCSINLIHNGFSQRNWVNAIGKDLYKGNGRIRQEQYFIEQGPFQSISMISYQSDEINNNKENLYDFGGEYHLDVHVFRNSKMFPQWKTHEKFNVQNSVDKKMSGYSRGHQEDARRLGILDFIKSVNNKTLSNSDFLSHENGIRILSAIYQSAIKKRENDNPLISTELN